MAEMALENLIQEKVYLEKSKYDDAESDYYRELSKGSSSNTSLLKQDLKVQNLSRNVPVYKNCPIYTEIIEMHKSNNVNELLIKVQKWDIKNKKNQFKKIINCECLVCFFKTDDFYNWKCHIMSQSHLAGCLKIDDLYSYVCTSSVECKVVLYGPLTSLIKHIKCHSNSSKISGIPCLMFTVMKRPVFEQDPLYFCSHCKKFGDKPIHDDERSIVLIKQPVKYYCKFCRVHFFSTSEMIDYHSLTVEHITLKCFFELRSKVQIKSSKQKKNQIKDNKELSQDIKDKTKKLMLSILKQYIPSVQEFNLIKFANNDHPQMGQINKNVKKHSLSKNLPVSENSSVCNKVIEMYKNNNIDEFLAKVKQWDSNIETQFRLVIKYNCLMCSFKTDDFYNWKCHIMSLSHLAGCLKIDDLYSYVCTSSVECKVVLYGPLTSLIEHQKCHFNSGFNISGVSLLMFTVMKRPFFKQDPLYFCSHCKKFGDKPIHDDERSIVQIKHPVKYYCKSCRVHFFSSPEMIDYHSLTVEHMTLKCFYELYSNIQINSNEIELSKQDQIKETMELSQDTNDFTKESQESVTELPILKQDIPPVQKSNSIKIANFEHPQKKQINKTLLDNIEKAQKSHVNKVHDQSNSHTQCSKTDSKSDMQSIDIKQYEQYQKYFKHKIKLLSTLRDYTDRIMNTLSYYCTMCDFVCEEKYVWDNHNKNKHADDTNRPTVFCSTCFILIIGIDASDHNRTIEHCNLLKFIKPLETDVIKNTTILEDSVDHFTTLEEECESQIDLNITDSINGVNVMQVETEIIPEENVHKESQKEITTNLSDMKLPLDPISGNSSKLFSTKFKASENKKSHELEDQSYGQYVAQRLNNIENATLKQNIKLEIDYLFYSKMKQFNTKY